MAGLGYGGKQAPGWGWKIILPGIGHTMLPKRETQDEGIVSLPFCLRGCFPLKFSPQDRDDVVGCVFSTVHYPPLERQKRGGAAAPLEIRYLFSGCRIRGITPKS